MLLTLLLLLLLLEGEFERGRYTFFIIYLYFQFSLNDLSSVFTQKLGFLVIKLIHKYKLLIINIF